VAGFAERLSKLANGVFSVSAVAYQWDVGRSFDRLNELPLARKEQKKASIRVYS
jgi:hypothetical protein